MIGRSRRLRPKWFRRSVLPLDQWSSWDSAESDLLADRDQCQRISELAADLSVEGFENPVTVGRDRWWDLRPRVRDGMHRSIAAMQLGIDIPVRFGEPMMDGYGEQDEYTVTLLDTSCDFDALFDRVFTLASFRSGDGFWVRCDTASANSERGEVLLLLPRRPDRRELIALEVADRLRDAGITARVDFTAEA